ncbi:MAG TPA: hypothetical protein VFK37_04435 [Bacillales bacterium]|nr:hypothetical protein [Bacillales bacterium]
MAVAGFKAQVNVSGTPVAFADEPTTPNADLTTYQINDNLKRVWDAQADITVEQSTDGGTTWNATDPKTYKLNRLTGTVLFDAAQASGEQVRVSGQYLPMSKAAEAYEYKYKIEADNQDQHEFGVVYNKRVQGLKDVTGSIKRWYQTNSFFFDALNNEDVVVLEFYSDSSAASPDLKAWAILSGDKPSVKVDGLVEEEIDFEGTEDRDGRAVAIG